MAPDLSLQDPVPRNVTRRGRGRRRIFSWALMFVVFIATACGVLSYVGIWQARVAIEARQQQAARRWLQATGACWPKTAEWYFLSAIVSRRDKDFDGVERNLKKANELGWTVADLERQQTIAQAQSGQFQEVGNRWSKLFQSAGSDGPEICRAYVNFLLSRFRLNDVATVLKVWRTDFPDDPEPLVIEGNITAQLHQWSKAETLFRQALDVDQSAEGARQALAETLIEQLRFDEAEEQLHLVPEANAESPEVVAALARCVAHLGRLDEALGMLKEAIEKTPGSIRLLAEMGRLQLMSGNDSAAVTTLAEVIAQQPENTEIRYAYAQALRNSGAEEDAQRHFQIVDEGTKALRGLSRLTEAVVQNPTDVDSRFKVASITWNWKSRRDGLAWLRSVLEFDPNHKPTHALLARHYAEQGDPEKSDFHQKMSEDSE